MAESPTRMQPILDLFASVGCDHAPISDISVSDKIVGGLIWCIAAIQSANSQSGVVSSKTFVEENKIEICNHIEEALRLMKCPHSLQAVQIQNLDVDCVFPVAEWLVDRVRTFREEDERKTYVVSELQHLRDRIVKEGAETMGQKLLSVLQSLKDQERQESKSRFHYNAKQSQLRSKINELEEEIVSGTDSKSIDGLNCKLRESSEEFNLAKKELATMLRAVLAVKRQLDDVPFQSELIQYDCRSSELYTHIQRKHQQTQKYYDTYNALLEIKELMLKETSLLNSISSQFQDAITSTAGRMKLIGSMEGILKGSQQKLEKVQHGLQEEQKFYDALRERYSASIAEQRKWYSLLKALQEECAKNDRHQSLNSV